jgi:hypothetical protein
LNDPRTVATLLWPHATADHVVARVPAHHERPARPREPGARPPGREAQAIRARRTILDEQLGETNRVEIEREEMLAEAQLASNAASVTTRQAPPTGSVGRWRDRTICAPGRMA